MQTVAAAILPGPAAAERLPEAGGVGQNMRAGVKEQPGSGESPFQKCLAQGTGGTGKTQGDPATGAADDPAAGAADDPATGTAGNSATGAADDPITGAAGNPATGAADADESDNPERDGDLCAAAAANGLIAQLFVSPPQDGGGETEDPSREEAATIAAPRPDGGESMAAAAALQAEAEAASASGTEVISRPAAMSAAPYGDVPTTRRDGEKRQTQPPAAERGGEAGQAAGADSVVSRIEEAMRSLGKEGDGEQSFAALLSDEKNRVTAKRMQANPAAWEAAAVEKATDGAESAEKSRAVEKALDRFAQDFRAAATEKNELRIVLEPERLGVLTISVSRTENGVSAKIKSEDKEICALLSGHVQRLIQIMEGRGVAVESVDVVFGGAEQNLSDTQSGPGGGSGNPWSHAARQGEKTEDVQAVRFFDLWNVPAGGAGTGSTVEYRV